MPEKTAVPFFTPDMADCRRLLSEIRRTTLEKEAQGKSQTARKLTFCQKKLQKFLKGQDIPLADIDAAWLQRLEGWMRDSEGLKGNTVATYIRLLYNTCRLASKDGAEIDLGAFGSTVMANATSPRSILTAEEIRKFQCADFSGFSALQRARELYLFALYCGGLEYKDFINLRFSDIEGDVIKVGRRRIPLITPAQPLLASMAVSEGNFILHGGDKPLPEEETTERQKMFDKILNVAVSKAGIFKKISFSFADASWRSIATEIAIPKETIDRIQSAEGDIADQEAADALMKVAAKADPDRMQWFAIKCTDSTPETLSDSIGRLFPTVKMFHPEVDSYIATEKGAKKVRLQLLKNIIFFLAPAKTATDMKMRLHDIAYIYDYQCGGKRVLATIPPKDMKTFMYFNEIAPDRIAYFFPEEESCPELDSKTEVMIVDGKWKGGTGKVVGPCRDDAKKTVVAVEMPKLGITVSAPVPNIFIKRLSD